MAQILVFGDSITDGAFDPSGGWADRLKQHFMAKNMQGDVVQDENDWVYNLGISGNLTDDVQERIETESIARKVDRENRKSIFVFAIGINDSCRKGDDNPLPRSNEEKFVQNYNKLIDLARRYTNKIICVGLTPVDEKQTTPIYNLYWYKNDRISQFDKLIRELATKSRAEFVDVHKAYLSQPDFKELLIDGLHPNEAGHRIIFNLVKPIVEQALETK